MNKGLLQKTVFGILPVMGLMAISLMVMGLTIGPGTRAAMIVDQERAVSIPPLPEQKPLYYERSDIPHLVGGHQTILARHEDTLIELAVEHNIGYVELKAANPDVDHLLPGEGTPIVIPNRLILPEAPRRGIVINLAELRLYYFPPEGDLVTLPIGVGRQGLNTPIGRTHIRTKVEGPKWRPTPRMRKEDPDLPELVEAGPDNPLGSHALYLGWPAYLIHGTQKPSGIGRRVSSGCIRMYPDHIKRLYETIPVETEVNVIDQPIKIAWHEGELYLEAQPDGDQSDEIEFEGYLKTIHIPEGVIERIRGLADDQADRLNWPVIRNTLLERTGMPVMITVPDL